MSDRMTLFFPNLFLWSKKPMLHNLIASDTVLALLQHLTTGCRRMMSNLCTDGLEILPQEFGEPHPELSQATCITRREKETLGVIRGHCTH